LNQVIARSGIQNATWVQARLPAAEYDGQFKLAVSRATFQPKEVLERLAPLVSEKGYIVMMAATQPSVEWPNPWRLVESHSFDVGGAPRWIASFKRQEE
jgi:16S rRNA G527 N7-methylase RsmG